MAGDRRALLIATSNYSDRALTRLRSPAGDVKSLAKVLSDPGIGNFDVLEPLVDRTTDEAKQGIEQLFEDAQRNDVLLLYLSGHGVISRTQRLYFATRTTKLKLLRATAIEDSFVNDLMKHSRARSVVLVLDCCHSGAFGKDLAMKGAIGVPIEQRFEGQGRIVLTASTALEYAFEETEAPSRPRRLGKPVPSSLFTRYLIEGLETGEADLDGDGKIVLDELYEYVYDRVRERSTSQTPSRTSSGHGEIVIARSRHGAAVPDEVQSAIAQALNHPWPGVRETAIGELMRIRPTADVALAAVINDALRGALDDDSRRVAAAAQRALEAAKGPSIDPVAAPPTIPVDVTPSDHVQKQAAPERPTQKARPADAQSGSSSSQSPRRSAVASPPKARADPSLTPSSGPTTQTQMIAQERSPTSSVRRAKPIAQRVRALNERIIDAAQHSDQAEQAAYETVVKTVAATINRAPATSAVEWLCCLADVQAEFIVKVISAWKRRSDRVQARPRGRARLAWTDRARELLGGAAHTSVAAQRELPAARIRHLTESIIDAAQRSDYDYDSLATYEMVLKSVETAIWREPGSSDLEWISSLATVHAKFIAGITDGWTTAVRAMLLSLDIRVLDGADDGKACCRRSHGSHAS
jgi:uncharacterized caspase-like protein